MPEVPILEGLHKLENEGEVSLKRRKYLKLGWSLLFAAAGLAWLLASSIAQARIVHSTDWEGRIEPLLELVKAGEIVLGQNDSASLGPGITKFIFGGDLLGRGPHSLRLMNVLTSLKKSAPDRVVLLWGNHEWSKASFALFRSESNQQLANLEDKAYREFLAVILRSRKVPVSLPAMQSINSVENRFAFWAEKMGQSSAVEFHRQELSNLKGTSVSLRDARLDFLDLITNPHREYLKYLQLGQLAHVENNALFVHGGLPALTGFVPESSVLTLDMQKWAQRLNEFGSAGLAEFVLGLGSGKFGPSAKRMVFYGDALFDSIANRVVNHNNSVIYGPRYRQNGTFRLPPDPQLTALAQSGVRIVVLGHSPAGHLPMILRDPVRNILYVFADVSYTKNGVFSGVSIEGDVVKVRGTMGDGTGVSFSTSATDVTSPIGMMLGDELVIAQVANGDYVLFRYGGAGGRSIEERVVAASELPRSSLKPPRFETNEVEVAARQKLEESLTQREQQVIELETFETQFLSSRTPILFAGSSAYADPNQAKFLDDFANQFLGFLNPNQAYVVSGSTNSGAEKSIHDSAKRLGLPVHGLIVSAALAENVARSIPTLSVVGPNWSNQPIAGMELIKKSNGFGVMLGGGGGLTNGIQFGDSIGAKVFAASNVSHGNGGISASMTYAQSHPDRAFQSARQLRALVAQDFPKALRINTTEASPEAAVAQLRSAGRLVIGLTGSSANGYQDVTWVRRTLRTTLEAFDQSRTILLAGGTPEGIGIGYFVANELGMETRGVVSSKAATSYLSPLSDLTYRITDSSWGGYLPGTQTLSPTSRANVEAMDIVISIGGGAITRDEFLAIVAAGKPAMFISAEMNHEKATARALKAGLPAPSYFGGELELELKRRGLLSGTVQTWNWPTDLQEFTRRTLAERMRNSVLPTTGRSEPLMRTSIPHPKDPRLCRDLDFTK